MVIAPVGMQCLRARQGRPRRPRTGGMPRSSGMSCVTSLRLPPVRDRASGMPWRSAITWCLEPVLPRPAGLGPVSGRPSAPARGNCRSPPWRLDELIIPLVTARAPSLLALHGIGPDTAALLLIAAGDHPQRLRSEAAWAHLCAVAPIPASSGKITRRPSTPAATGRLTTPCGGS